MTALASQLAQELSVQPAQIEAAIRLLDEGASVPFIARYRKEVTQGLDDAQLRALEARLLYVRELNDRRDKILESLLSQGKLSPALKAQLEAASQKSQLEDIYLPYRPRKTSKALQAREAGLAPFAERILTDAVDPTESLAGFQHDSYPDSASQLAAIQHLILEQWATEPGLLDQLRASFVPNAQLVSQLSSEDKKDAGQKFRDYFDAREPLQKVASHRLLAMLRGQHEKFLTLSVQAADDGPLADIQHTFALASVQPDSRREFLLATARLLWLGKLRPHLERSLMDEQRQKADAEAIAVFAENLRHVLLAAPAGGRCTLGVDPGIRTGVKLAVVGQSGDVVAHETIYPFAPKNDRAGALATLERLCREHSVQLAAIGNGTASRETEALLTELSQQHPELALTRVMVSEAGASVYSASALASEELPTLDVSIRGAVSIARRLQDPLAELVKIDAKSIGVGQYQHDVSQQQLARTLDAVVEDCVNAVGVNVNTASPALLARIAGLNSNIAQQIVQYREAHGPFDSREGLRKVPRLGARTFEQAAGFLRIQGGSQPLDASAVHPESYPLVEKILQTYQLTLEQVLGKPGALSVVSAESLVEPAFGLPTIQDVLAEMEKPGRDPRPEFRTARFRDDIQQVKDLQEGMRLEGVVTNVTNFGAFIDVGVHQDGLVHVSELSDQFVSDPHTVVKPGQIVQVRVVSVDVERKRISLSLKLTPTDKPARGERPPRAAEGRSGPARDSRATGSRPERSDRPQRQPSDKAASQPGRSGGGKAAEPARLGSLGALLQQAGLTGSQAKKP